MLQLGSRGREGVPVMQALLPAAQTQGSLLPSTDTGTDKAFWLRRSDPGALGARTGHTVPTPGLKKSRSEIKKR